MKYIILVCDGAADWPIEELGNKTILESAEIPSMDWIASHGQMGLLKTIPEGMDPGSAIATDRLGIKLFPYTLLIAPDGRFIQRIAGPRQWQRQEVVDLLEKAYGGDYSGLSTGH